MDIGQLHLKNNAHDSHAFFDLPGCPMKLYDQFPRSCGPRDPVVENSMGAVFDALCKQASDKIRIREEEEAGRQGATSSEVVAFAQSLEENQRLRRAAVKRAPKKRARPDSIVVDL